MPRKQENRKHSRYAVTRGKPLTDYPFATPKPRGSKTLMISPELAQTFLKASYGNRRIRDEQVHMLSREMTDGLFSPLARGASVKFDEKHYLRDGHHTLFAVIKANMSVNVGVAWGLSELECTQIDSNVNRSYADYAAIANIDNAPAVTALARSLINWDQGNYIDRAHNKPTVQEVMDFADANLTELYFAADKAKEMLTTPEWRLKLTPKALGMFIFLTSQIDEAQAATFLKELFSLQLYKREVYYPLVEAAEGHKTFSWLRSYGAQLIVLCEAWNRWRDGVMTKYYPKSMVTIVLKEHGQFPVPH